MGRVHAWLAQRTGHAVPLTSVTPGTLVGFVRRLDQVKVAAPNSIGRRITGVTVTAHREGAEVSKAATLAARTALKPMLVDPVRLARGRGQAVAAIPAHLRAGHCRHRRPTQTHRQAPQGPRDPRHQPHPRPRPGHDGVVHRGPRLRMRRLRMITIGAKTGR